jgi:hypothetical protein
MVRWVVKRSLRAASCCSVEVMNGGAGLRRRCLRSTFSTVSRPLAAAAIVSVARVAPASSWRSN